MLLVAGDKTHFELDVIASKSDFKLLSSVLVFLGPPRIVFLHYFAVLNDALDLGYEEGADTHYIHVNMHLRLLIVRSFVLSLRMSESLR